MYSIIISPFFVDIIGYFAIRRTSGGSTGPLARSCCYAIRYAQWLMQWQRGPSLMSG